ncbi:pentatricopeptide repeat-containing protein [Pyrus ussuriensis x Pyrus communis]|uniref:Pentatricopeptide repeat-containing protein n=1 Tax=Pyrus ussuriensis x Pyrus communis TaxID=2448454 RepID=A0A5N5HG94_9ROSA|nr:pentatricopeptide repeat-containing protein [Pyrus ussuriensis x Pyrus communis]
MAWQRPRFRLPCLCCLSRRKKLLDFDFSVAIDRVIEDGAAKIKATEDEVSGEQTAECKVVTEGRMAAGEPKVIQAVK